MYLLCTVYKVYKCVQYVHVCIWCRVVSILMNGKWERERGIENECRVILDVHVHVGLPLPVLALGTSTLEKSSRHYIKNSR